MSGETITRMSLVEASLHKGETDWEWLKKQDAAGVGPEADPEEGEFGWSQARVVMPPSKQIISVRIDRDVLGFFKSQGRGYQTRINADLRIDLQVAVLVQALDGLDARIGAGERPAAAAVRVHVPLSGRRWFTPG